MYSQACAGPVPPQARPLAMAPSGPARTARPHHAQAPRPRRARDATALGRLAANPQLQWTAVRAHWGAAARRLSAMPPTQQAQQQGEEAEPPAADKGPDDRGHETDYVVVGSGIGGARVAAAAARRPKRPLSQAILGKARV